MPPKPTNYALPPAPSGGPPKPHIISAAVKAAAAAAAGKVNIGIGGSGNNTAKQPPKKKKTVVKAKRPGFGNSPVVMIGKDDTLHPPPSKLGVMKNRPIVGKKDATTAAVDSIQFSSQYTSPKKKTSNTATSSSSNTGGAKTAVSPISTSVSQMQQFKLERAQIAKRELAEMDAIERAFREDASVWAGPTNVVFPRRYHVEKEDVVNDEVGRTKKKDKGDNDKKKSSINNPYMAFYGPQSQGWMYGEGYAGIGGRSWMEATTPSNAADKKKKKDKKSDSNASPNVIDDATTNKSNKSFLMDDVTIIENSLRSNGLTRNDVTPKAYACFLEQARRYALELLADAQDYAIHAQRNTIPSLLPADLLLAAEMREDGGGGVHGVSSTLPTPEEIGDLASEVNRAPLPPIPTNCYNGVAMPPVEQQLTARTYDVVNGARVAQRMMRGGDLPLTTAELGLAKKTTAGGGVSKGGEGSRGSSSNSSPSSKKKRVGSYGAGKGRQISVHMKSKTSGSSSVGNITGSSIPGAAAAAAAVKAATGSTTLASGKTTTSKSGPKGQKRKLTEL